MRGIPSRSARDLQTDLAAVRRLLAREKKKLAEERVWHAWTAAFRIHEDIRCTTLKIQLEEMKAETDRLREAAKNGVSSEDSFEDLSQEFCGCGVECRQSQGSCGMLWQPSGRI